MKVVEKGEYGYIGYRKKFHSILTVVGFVVVFAIFLIGFLICKTKNNIATVMAIVTVLPVAKFAVTLLMVAFYKSPDRELFDELKSIGSNLTILSDCVMTCKDKSLYVEFALVTDTCVYCYTRNEKFDTKYFEENVEAFIKSCGDTVSVKLIKDFNTFKQRVSSLNNVEMKKNKLERVKNAFLILVI